MKRYKTFFPTCSGRRSAVGWSGFLSGTIFHAFRAGFFLSSKGPSFFWGKGSLLAGLLFKRKEAISHTIILRGGGRQSNLLFLQKEAKLSSVLWKCESEIALDSFEKRGFARNCHFLGTANFGYIQETHSRRVFPRVILFFSCNTLSSKCHTISAIHSKKRGVMEKIDW